MQGHHEQAIVRLVENCSSEELTVQLQKMLRLRHELCAKLEDTANDMRREIHALKAAGQYMCTQLLAPRPNVLGDTSRPEYRNVRVWTFSPTYFPGRRKPAPPEGGAAVGRQQDPSTQT